MTKPVRVVDFTQPLGPDTPVLPGDPAVTLTPAATHASDGYAVTGICLGSHSGTHIDAPRHFFPDGPALSDFPVERFIGEGVILDLRPPVHAGGRDVGSDQGRGLLDSQRIDAQRLAAALHRHPLQSGDRVLLWTGGAATLTREAAAMLVEAGVSLVGIDGPSIEAEGAPAGAADTVSGASEPRAEAGIAAGAYPVHRLLLGSGVLIAENLCRLELLGEGRLQCALLPLAIQGTDGAPVRAVGWR